MSYFLSGENLTVSTPIIIQGDEARHILLSRRIKPGEQIFIQGVDGKRFVAEVVQAKKDSVTVLIKQEANIPQELPVKVCLFQAVVNEKALDTILQKSTELGAAGVVLFNSHNVATKLPLEKFKAKLPRWEKILWEAAKQSDRAKIPELKFVENLPRVLLEAKNFQQCVVLDVSGQKKLSKPSTIPMNAAFIVGPEGGFTEQELEDLKTANIQTLNISPFTLRAETAAIAGLVYLIAFLQQ